MTKVMFVTRSASKILTCAAIAALAPACAELDDPDDPTPASATATVSSDLSVKPRVCFSAAAGQGFVTMAIPNATVLSTVEFSATVDTVGLDAVVALSAGAPTSFNNLATAVRFNTSGTVDVRNGGAYAADTTLSYGTSELDFRVIADMTSKTYSTFQGTTLFAQELAKQYAFRPTATGTHLDHISLEVDGPSGSITVCTTATNPSTGVVYSRETNFVTLPLASNTALISSGTTTQKLNATGQTTATLGIGGELATDTAGNFAIASVTGTTLTVDKVNASFGALWHATQTVTSGVTIQAVNFTAAGNVQVALSDSTNNLVVVAAFVSSTGASLSPRTFSPGGAASLDDDQVVVATNDTTNGILLFVKASPTGVVWVKTFSGNASITAITTDASHNTVFGGALSTPIDFGGGTLPTHSSENGPFNSYVVKLSSTGTHVFSTRTNFFSIDGISTNATRIAVSNTERTQFFRPHLLMFDNAGTSVTTTFSTGFGEFGRAHRVAINATGRVWWNMDTIWPRFNSFPYLLIVTP